MKMILIVHAATGKLKLIPAYYLSITGILMGIKLAQGWGAVPRFDNGGANAKF